MKCLTTNWIKLDQFEVQSFIPSVPNSTHSNTQTSLLFNVCRSYKLRIYPNKTQEEILVHTLFMCCNLHNASLQERRDAWKHQRKQITRYQQDREIKFVVKELPEYGQVYSQVLHEVLKRVDLAYKAFFRRVKRGEKPGYPRFKSKKRYDSFTYPQPSKSVKLNQQTKRISCAKLFENVRYKDKRVIEGTIKTVTIRRQAGKWYAVLSCDNVPSKLIHGTGEIGIDVGIKSLATLSNGKTIKNHKFGEKSQERLTKAQQNLSRKQKGSKRRRKAVLRVQKIHAHIANQRKYNAFKVANKLVTTYDTIAVEKLDIQNLVEKNQYNLQRHISDASWGILVHAIKSKAEEAGTLIVEVDPKHTSQVCSRCGVFVWKKLSVRTHKCPNCGLKLDRDHNSAKIIEQRARLEPSWSIHKDAVKREAFSV